MSQSIRNIELLAPAKDYLSAVDAIDCGADAIYIGAGRFGARYAATNTTEDIARAVEYAHRFGVKVYVTLNTLLFDNELQEAQTQAEALVAEGEKKCNDYLSTIETPVEAYYSQKTDESVGTTTEIAA